MKKDQGRSSGFQLSNAGILVENPCHIHKYTDRQVSTESRIRMIGLRGTRLDAVKETIADVSSIEQIIRFILETSAIVSSTASITLTNTWLIHQFVHFTWVGQPVMEARELDARIQVAVIGHHAHVNTSSAQEHCTLSHAAACSVPTSACIGGWLNGTAKSSQLARKHSIY